MQKPTDLTEMLLGARDFAKAFVLVCCGLVPPTNHLCFLSLHASSAGLQRAVLPSHYLSQPLWQPFVFTAGVS